MNDNELCALRTVIDYLWKDEKRDYEASEPEAHANHIFTNLLTLKAYLKKGEN